MMQACRPLEGFVAASEGGRGAEEGRGVTPSAAAAFWLLVEGG